MMTKPAVAPCFHGGAAYQWIGDQFENLASTEHIIDADVLDAWFDPSPKVIGILKERLAWSLRCSPPAAAVGVEQAISSQIGIYSSNIVCGAGSSSLMFLALRDLLCKDSKVLVLDPTYGEYAHILNNVIGCGFHSFELCREEDYVVNLDELSRTVCSHRYDLVIIVNPNNPTGKKVDRESLESLILSFPRETVVWIDEAYIDYDGGKSSLTNFAVRHENVIVCKSLSKSLALSGLRAGYLVSNRVTISRLKLITAPWSLSLPGQLALIAAFKDSAYYECCYERTREMRSYLANQLRSSGFNVHDSTANFLLVEYSEQLPIAEEFISACNQKFLLVRNIRSMGRVTCDHSFRIAVKSEQQNERMLEILRQVKLDLSR